MVFPLASLGRLSVSYVNRASMSSKLPSNNGRILSRSQHDLTKGNGAVMKGGEKEKGPVKFTTSKAHLDYKATMNFYGDTRTLPKSHNIMLAGTGIFGFYYLIFLRDDIENDGGMNLIRPVHETIPEMAIPLLQASIAENKKFGNDTRKLEKKLAEYMKNPDKHGGERKKLIEN